MNKNICVIGAGDVGCRFAQLRAQKNDRVFAMRRRRLPMPKNVEAVYGDFNNANDLAQIPHAPDILLFSATPDARTEAAYRRTFVDGFQLALKQVKPKRVVLLSSTAVYAQNNAEWIDEHSEANATRFNAVILREAEAICAEWPEHTIVRLSGLTGPGRHQLINKALLGEGITNVWSNRIHVHDAASALDVLCDLDNAPKLLLASDDEPALQMEVANWIRQRHQLPALHELLDPETGRRIRNSALRRLGWQAKYPSYREAYAFAKMDEINVENFNE